MEEKNYITAQKYAAIHRMSLHTVIKKTMGGELRSFEKEENGKKTIYVYLPDAKAPVSNEENTLPSSDQTMDIDYKSAYESLHQEYLILKTKYEKLLKESR